MGSDILQVQEYLHQGLRSCALFDRINVALERKFLATSDVEISSLWLTPRQVNADGTPASPVGACAIIEMPRLELRQPNSLQRSLIVSVGIIEERNFNMTPSSGGAPGGTRVSAEEWAELALDFMFGWMMGLSGGMVPQAGTVKPAPDLIQGDGLVSYRAAVEMRREHQPLARCETPTLSESSPGQFVFVNGPTTPDAAIYYMIAGTRGDLSLPGKDNVQPDNMGAVLWEGAPVPIVAGQFVNWAAWQDDRLPSHITAKKIT